MTYYFNGKHESELAETDSPFLYRDKEMCINDRRALQRPSLKTFKVVVTEEKDESSKNR